MVIMPKVRVEATDLLMAKVVADNSEASHSMAEAIDLSIIHTNFRIMDLREVHTRVTAINTVVNTNPTFRVIKQTHIEVEATAVVLNRQEDAIEEELIAMIIITTSISITHMSNRPNSTVHLVAYAEVLIIPQSIVTRENMI